MHLRLVLLFLGCVVQCRADYNCLCCNHEEREIYQAPSADSHVVGYMYRFDCFPLKTKTNTQWQSVLFDHQVGYVLQDSLLEVKVCFGDIPPETALTTSAVAASSTTINQQVFTTKSTTTSEKTTSTQSTTLTTTANPSTSMSRTPSASSLTTPSTTMSISPYTTKLSTSSTVRLTTSSTTLQPTTSAQPQRSATQSTTQSRIPTRKTTPTSTQKTLSLTTPATISSTASTSSAKQTTSSTSKPSTIKSTIVSSATMTALFTTPPSTSNFPTKSTTVRMHTIPSSTKKQSLTNTVASSSTQYYSQSYLRTLCPSTPDHGDIATHGHSCYEFVGCCPNNFSHAELDCQKHGGFLFEVLNSQEKNFILNLLRRVGFDGPVWMGLHDRGVEGHYEWVSGRQVNYTNWIPGHKTYQNEQEDCVLFLGLDWQGQWKDVHCKHGQDDILMNARRNKHAWICQYSAHGSPNHMVSTSLPSPAITINHQGPNHLCPYTNNHVLTTVHGSNCYQYNYGSKTWFDADFDCTNKGGQLFESHSSSDNNFFQHFISHANTGAYGSVWMGLHDLHRENRFEWLSGTKLGYTNWIYAHIDPVTHRDDDCVLMKANGKWDDVDCQEGFKHHWICQFMTMTGKPTTMCPVSTAAIVVNAVHKNSCYQLVYGYATWEVAQQKCQHGGGFLFEVLDGSDEQFILHMLTNAGYHGEVWMGLHDRAHENRFQWISGSPVTYHNWLPGHRDRDNHDIEDCVVFMTQDGTWDDEDCGSTEQQRSLHHWICQYRAH